MSYLSGFKILLGKIDTLFCKNAQGGSDFQFTLEKKAAHFDELSDDVKLLMQEQFPDTATDGGNLIDWVNMFDIPYTMSYGTEQERRNLVIAKLRDQGGFARSDFEVVLQGLGYTVVQSNPTQPDEVWLREGYYRPFRVDISEVDENVVLNESDSHKIRVVKVIGTNSYTDARIPFIFETKKCMGVTFEYEEPV